MKAEDILLPGTIIRYWHAGDMRQREVILCSGMTTAMTHLSRLTVISSILLLSQAGPSQITPEWLEKLDSQVVGMEYKYSDTSKSSDGLHKSPHLLRVYSEERIYEEYILHPRPIKKCVYYEAPHAATIIENGYVNLNSQYSDYDDPGYAWHRMNALPNIVLGRGFSRLQDLTIKKVNSTIIVNGKAEDQAIITAIFDHGNRYFPERVERRFANGEATNVWRYAGKIETKDGVIFPKRATMTVLNGDPSLDGIVDTFEFQDIRPLTSSYTNGWFDPKYTYREKRVNPSVAWEYEEILAAAGQDVTLEELLALSQGKLDKINQRVSQFEKSKGNSFFSNPLYITLILLGAALVLMGKKLFSKAARRQ